MTYVAELKPLDLALESDQTHGRLYPDASWLIRLRWIAIAGVIVASTVATHQRVVESGTPLFIIAGVMALFNLFLWWRYRDISLREAHDAGSGLIFPQLFVDLGSLTLLLHYAGGAENPFAMFYAFHVAIGAVFLPRRTVWLVGLLAGVLNSSMVLGEFSGMLEHHTLTFTQPPDLPPHMHRTPHDMHLMPEFILSYLVAFNLMLVGIIHLVQTVAEYQRAAEGRRQKTEQIALARERLARVGEITADLAHTIRNPLHGVINAIELLRNSQSGQDASVDEMVNMMMDSLVRIEKVTGRLLALTRDSKLSRAITDLGLLVQEAVRFIEPRAQEKNIRLEVKTDAVPAIAVDPDLIFEALVNLLDNAVAACREGDAIRVTTTRPRAPRNGVCIRVEDTGVGIPAPVLGKVLDPFFTTKPVGEGSGLGLAITHRIVDAHQGELTLQSTVGKGTRIQMYLPAASA